jgi:hypothetical protein
MKVKVKNIAGAQIIVEVVKEDGSRLVLNPGEVLELPSEHVELVKSLYGALFEEGFVASEPAKSEPEQGDGASEGEKKKKR